MKLNALILLVVCLLPINCFAATYKWVDGKGTVGFSDDLGNIPKPYRAKALLVEENQQSVEVIESQAQGKVPAKDKNENQPLSKNVQAKEKALYGGKDEDAWRKEFSLLKNDIKGTAEFVLEKKARLTDTAKMSRGEYISLQNSIKDAEIRLDGLRKKLDVLESAAEKANVPKSAY